MALGSVTISWDYDPNINSVKVEYKKQSETAWTVPTSSTNPTIGTSYPLILETEVFYDIKLTAAMASGCTPLPVIYQFVLNPDGNTTTTTTTTSTTTTTTSTTSTTTTTLFVPPVQKTFANLASPYTLMYNSTNHNIYFTDYDAPHSLRYFDPATAQDQSDFVDVDSTNIGLMHLGAAVYNAATNKVYAHGDDSGGMIIVDCSDNTLSKTIAYGADQLSNRQQMYLIDGTVYAYTLSGNKFVTVDTITEVMGTDFVPDSNSTYPVSSMIQAGTKLWVIQSGGSAARAISYNLSDLTTVVNVINNIATQLNSTGHIDVNTAWLDSSTGEIWFCSPGDQYIGVINTNTFTLSHTIPVPMGGKTYARLSARYYAPTDTLYFSGALTNNSLDPGQEATFAIDRTHYTTTGSTANSYGQFVFAESTGFSYVAIGGLVYWNTPNTGYDTDGQVVVYGDSTSTTTTTQA